EGPRTHVRRKTLLQEKVLGGGFPFHRPFAILEPAPLQHAIELLPQDLAHQLARQWSEYDHLVEAVLKLRPERLANRPQHLTAGKGAPRRREAEARVVMAGGAEIGGQNDHAMPKV